MRKINHPLHIVLSILTGGFWLIPYAVILITRPNQERQFVARQQLLAEQAKYEAKRREQQAQGL